LAARGAIAEELRRGLDAVLVLGNAAKPPAAATPAAVAAAG
jgi:hypothetical protein